MNPFDLNGKKVLIFGAAGGIGAAVTRGFAAAGAKVALFDIQPPVALAQEVGGTVVGGDINDPGQVAAAVEKCGRLDVVVNLAYAAVLQPIVEMPVADFEMTVDTTLRGCFLISQHVGRALIQQGTGGSVIHFTTIAAAVALGRGTGAYAAAKAGVNALIRETAIEWGAHKIRVNGIAPCQTMTNALNGVLDDPRHGGRDVLLAKMQSKIPLGRLAQPADMVGPCLFLASDAAAMVTGQVLYVDGGYTAQ
jgi:NAD(P)-dependent dehydrogenase (short-subunit alcohol dehydrogenase family)